MEDEISLARIKSKLREEEKESEEDTDNETALSRTKSKIREEDSEDVEYKVTSAPATPRKQKNQTPSSQYLTRRRHSEAPSSKSESTSKFNIGASLPVLPSLPSSKYEIKKNFSEVQPTKTYESRNLWAALPEDEKDGLNFDNLLDDSDGHSHNSHELSHELSHDFSHEYEDSVSEKSDIHQHPEKFVRVKLRTYYIEQTKRQFLKHLLLWLFHDIPLGTCEFVTSTSIFLIRTMTKPFRVIWAMFGVYTELKGLLQSKPTAGTWASFLESDDIIPYTQYIYEFSLPMAFGVSVFLVVVPNIDAVMAIPFFASMFSAQGSLIIAAVSMVILGVLPSIVGVNKSRKITGFSQLNSIQTMLGTASSIMVVILLVTEGVLQPYLQGIIPTQLMIRWLPLILGSFLLGPSIGWFISYKFGLPDTTVTPPKFNKSWVAPTLGVSFGFIFIILAFVGSYFVTFLLPVQNLSVSSFQPSGDGVSRIRDFLDDNSLIGLIGIDRDSTIFPFVQ